MVLPPRSRVTVPCEVSVHEAGPFDETAELFVEDGGLRKLVMTVSGVGFRKGE